MPHHPLRIVLDDRGISQRRLARSLEPPVSHAYVSQVLAGKMAPSRRFRRQVAALLELPEALLFPVDREPAA